MTNRVEIIIDALNLAIDEVKAMDKGMEVLGDSARKGSKGLDEAKKSASILKTDFVNLNQTVDSYTANLKEATPQNIRFAKTFQDIKKRVDEGTLSLDKAQRELDQLQREMKEVDAQGKKFGQNFTKNFSLMQGKFLAVAAGITAAGFAAKKAFDFAKEGAEIRLVEERFDRLAVSIGTTGEALRGDLFEAMGGIVSKTEAMSGALDLMALGLVKNHNEAVRMAGIAGKLNMDMNQLVLTLSNQTTMRFDALGVSVDGFKEKVDKLKDSGMDASQAFSTAFMQQAEEQIEKMGDVADSTMGEFQELEANFKDVLDEMRSDALEGIVVPVRFINEGFKKREEVKKEEDEIREAFEKNILTQEDYIDHQERIAESWGVLADLEHDRTLELVAIRTETLDADTIHLTRSTNELIKAAISADKVMLQYAVDTEKAAGATKNLKSSLRDLQGSKINLADMVEMGNFKEKLAFDEIFAGNRWQDASNIQGAMTDHLLAQAQAMAELGAKGYDVTGMYDVYMDALARTDPELAKNMEASQAMTGFLGDLDEAFKHGVISGEEYFAIFDDLYDNILAGMDPVEAFTQATEDLGTAWDTFSAKGDATDTLANLLPEEDAQAMKEAIGMDGLAGAASDATTEFENLASVMPDNSENIIASISDVSLALETFESGYITPASLSMATIAEKLPADEETLKQSIENVSTKLNETLVAQLSAGATKATTINTQMDELKDKDVTATIRVNVIGAPGWLSGAGVTVPVTPVDEEDDGGGEGEAWMSLNDLVELTDDFDIRERSANEANNDDDDDGGAGVPHKGGQVQYGSPYIWKPGEELFIPSTDGYVIPNRQVSDILNLGGMGALESKLGELNQNMTMLLARTPTAGDIARAVVSAVQTTV